MTATPLPRRRRPCVDCPWRRDVEPGQFPAERYEVLLVRRDGRGDGRVTAAGPKKPRGATWVWCTVNDAGLVIRDDLTEREARADAAQFPGLRVARYFVGPVRLA